MLIHNITHPTFFSLSDGTPRCRYQHNVLDRKKNATQQHEQIPVPLVHVCVAYKTPGERYDTNILRVKQVPEKKINNGRKLNLEWE